MKNGKCYSLPRFSVARLGNKHTINLVFSSKGYFGGNSKRKLMASHNVVQNSDDVSSRYLPRSGVAGSYGGSIFNFLRNLLPVLRRGCTSYNPANSCTYVFLTSMLKSYLQPRVHCGTVHNSRDTEAA